MADIHTLEAQARQIVASAMSTRGAVTAPSLATDVAQWHQRATHLLHEVALEHGHEATATAAGYALVAVGEGLLYVGDELEHFVRDVAASVRRTSRDVAAGTSGR